MILAIDPGLSGGLAVSPTDRDVEGIPMPPTEGDFVSFVRSLRSSTSIRDTWVAYVEDVPWVVRSKVNPASVGKLHRNVGVIHGALLALGIPIIKVAPAVWQKPLRLGTRAACKSSTEWKNKLKAEAQRRFPGVNVTLATADALLILDWARGQVPSNPMVTDQ